MNIYIYICISVHIFIYLYIHISMLIVTFQLCLFIFIYLFCPTYYGNGLDQDSYRGIVTWLMPKYAFYAALWPSTWCSSGHAAFGELRRDWRSASM